MEPNEVQDVLAAVDKVSSVAGRVRDNAVAVKLNGVRKTLLELVGPVPANVAAGLLELGSAEVGKLSDRGVLAADKRGFAPQRLYEVLELARDLRARAKDLDKIRWWLEDRALLADEGLRQGLAKPGDEVLAPRAQQQVEALDGGSRKRFKAWLEKFEGRGAKETDYRVTGSRHQVRVKDLDALRVVVLEPPKAKRAVVLLVGPRTDPYGYVHLLGKTTPKSSRPTPPFFGSDDRLPDWTPALEALAKRAGALVGGR